MRNEEKPMKIVLLAEQVPRAHRKAVAMADAPSSRLIDLIGREYELALRTIEQSRIGEATWRMFLHGVGANLVSRTGDEDGTECRVHELEAQGQRLTLIAVKDPATGKLDVSHKLVDAKAPREIVIMQLNE